ncbi:MAG: hypothetical protein D6705_08905 [Deltaproteobacteria bacterium]|nr:MAG: hypothetical protein D6705_08905 [Deltaproteobacteria bacterium]
MAASRQRHLGAYLVAVAAVFVLVAAWWGETGRVYVVPDPPPRHLCAGGTTTVEAWVLAGPGVSLDGAEGDRLSHRTWVGGAVRDGPRSAVPPGVATMRPVRTELRIEAPSVPGAARILPAAVREGVRWYATGLAPFVVDVGPPAGRFAVTAGPPPTTGPAGAPVELRFDLRNEGCRPWDPARGDTVGVRFVSPADGRVLGEGRLLLPGKVAPGQGATVVGAVELPAEPGSVCIDVAPVLSDTGWGMADPGASARSCGHRVLPPAVAVAVEAASTAGPAVAGERLPLRVVLRNTGREPFVPGRDRIGVQIEVDGKVRDPGARLDVARRVEPGERVEGTVEVPLPADAAGRVLVVRPGLVREGVQWAVCTEGCDRAALRLVPAPPRLAYAAQALAASPWAFVGGDLRVAVRLVNAGTEPWDPARGDVLGVRVRAGDGLPTEHRLPLPAAVAPGADVWVVGALPAPTEPGAYRLEAQPLREGERWFPSVARGAVVATGRTIPMAPSLFALTVVAAVIARRRPYAPMLAVAWTLALLSAERSVVEAAGIRPWPEHGRVVLGLALLAGVLRWGAGRRRGVRSVAFAAALVGASVVTADGALLRVFGSVLGPEHLLAWRQIPDVADSAAALAARAPHGALALVLVAALEVTSRRADPGRRPWLRPVLGTLALASVVLVGPLGRAITGPEARRIYDGRQLVARYGAFGAHVLRTVQGLRYGGRVPLPEGGIAAVRRRLEERRLPRPPAFGAGRGYDVVMIQAEALADWVLDAEVGGRPVVPTLRRWAREGTSLPLLDQTADGNTSDAELLALASLYPLERGAAAFLRADVPHHTLAHVLRAAGYTTISAHPFRGTFWNRVRTHPAYGFETSWFEDDFAAGPVVGWGLSDGAFLGQLAERISSRPSPIFVYAITLGLHHPYGAFPPHLAELDLPPEIEDTPLGNYLQAAAHLDRALADLERRLRAAGRWERTLVVVFGDHDPRLPPGPRPAEIVGVDEGPAGLPRVPFVLRGPPRLAAARTVAGQIDIAPTVLDVLGLDPPPTMLGTSILRPSARPSWVPRRGVVGRDRVLRWRDGAAECLDLSGRRRPREACAELSAQAAEARDLSRWLLDHGAGRVLAGSGAPGRAPARTAPSP